MHSGTYSPDDNKLRLYPACRLSSAERTAEAVQQVYGSSSAQLYHLSVCVERDGRRIGFVISAPTEGEACAIAETLPNRIGYYGNDSFAEACIRAEAMQKDEPGAWGLLQCFDSRCHICGKARPDCVCGWAER